MIVLMVYLLKLHNIAEVIVVKLIILWRSINTWCYKRALYILSEGVVFRIAKSNQRRHHAHAQVLLNFSVRMRISNGRLFYRCQKCTN